MTDASGRVVLCILVNWKQLHERFLYRRRASDGGNNMLDENFVTMVIGKAKHIALVAHDGKKKELVDWCDRNKEILKSHFLCGTGTTSRLISERTGLPVKG